MTHLPPQNQGQWFYPYLIRNLYRPPRLAVAPIPTSCLSGQRFASHFLQIRAPPFLPDKQGNSTLKQAPPTGRSNKKKRGSLSRVKSTPKEEGGGDKSELRAIAAPQFQRFPFCPNSPPIARNICALHHPLAYHEITYIYSLYIVVFLCFT